VSWKIGMENIDVLYLTEQETNVWFDPELEAAVNRIADTENCNVDGWLFDTLVLSVSLTIQQIDMCARVASWIQLQLVHELLGSHQMREKHEQTVQGPCHLHFITCGHGIANFDQLVMKLWRVLLLKFKHDETRRCPLGGYVPCMWNACSAST